MANATASNFTITPRTRRTVTTVEHFDWDAEAQEWKPTEKSVTTEEEPAPEQPLPISPWMNPWPSREPYRPYFPVNPPGMPQIYC